MFRFHVKKELKTDLQGENGEGEGVMGGKRAVGGRISNLGFKPNESMADFVLFCLSQ